MFSLTLRDTTLDVHDNNNGEILVSATEYNGCAWLVYAVVAGHNVNIVAEHKQRAIAQATKLATLVYLYNANDITLERLLVLATRS